jgi:hypothetical protein
VSGTNCYLCLGLLNGFAEHRSGEIAFWGIAVSMVIFCGINGAFAGEVNGVKVWPVTYLMFNVLQGGASLS